MRDIAGFYADNGKPYRLSEILTDWTDDDWDTESDFIEWLFPVKSELAVGEIDTLLDVPDFHVSYFQAFKRFSQFLGYDVFYVQNKHNISYVFEQLIPEIYHQRFLAVWDKPNHNWTRITRVIRSLRVMGFAELSVRFFTLLQKMRAEQNIDSTNECFYSWYHATVDPIV